MTGEREKHRERENREEGRDIDGEGSWGEREGEWEAQRESLREGGDRPQKFEM